MIKFFRPIPVCALLLCVHFASAQNLKDIANKAENQLGGNGGGNNFSNISNTDAISGLKEALTIGSQNASKRLSATDGFFGNAAIKILMPPEAKKAESTMRKVGMGSQVDKAILSMNRAAEDASSRCVPIFRDAILHMSLTDGISILRGGDGAATRYLKSTTSSALTAAFKPEIKTSLDKVDATKYWAELFNAYDKLPFTSKVNTDLPAYVTERALNGLFVAIAEEENKIRKDPAAQVSGLLQKVFGGH
jgi:hypothetical protein